MIGIDFQDSTVELFRLIVLTTDIRQEERKITENMRVIGIDFQGSTVEFFRFIR